MTVLLSRQFVVDQPLDKARQYLAHVEHWPSWAKHIRQVELKPPGELGPNSTARLTLSNGVKSTLTMIEFNAQGNWKWSGRFLWLTITFDHRFEALNPKQTKLTWIVEASGFGISIFRSLLARFYGRNLDRAIPWLVKEMEQ
jgi:hypothetical protein